MAEVHGWTKVIHASPGDDIESIMEAGANDNTLLILKRGDYTLTGQINPRSNFGVWGNGARFLQDPAHPTGRAIQLTRPGFYIEDVTFESWDTQAIRFFGDGDAILDPNDCWIRGCSFLDCGAHATLGINGVGGGAANGGGITECYFTGCGGISQAGSDAGAIKISATDGFEISYNHIDGTAAGNGIWNDVVATNISILRNRVHGCHRKGIFYETCTYGIIKYNHVYDNVIGEESNNGALGLASASNTLVEGNIFDQEGGAYCIRVYNDGRGEPLNNVYRGNYFLGDRIFRIPDGESQDVIDNVMDSINENFDWIGDGELDGLVAPTPPPFRRATRSLSGL